MNPSSSINAGQREMRCPICCFRSKTFFFFFLHMTALQFDLLFMPSRYSLDIILSSALLSAKTVFRK